jgi:hypothetical protein
MGYLASGSCSVELGKSLSVTSKNVDEQREGVVAPHVTCDWKEAVGLVQAGEWRSYGLY